MMRFDQFVFDSARHRLTRDGVAVHLTPKAFELLSLLIEAAPAVVSKNEIHAHLWPCQVVSDATLVGLVKEIRRALGDRNGERRKIRTVHRVGYAFDEPLETPCARPAGGGLLVIGRRRARLIDGDNIIGRDPACDVWIDNATVSRRHARIVVTDKRVSLEDLGSKNGTYVGNARLDEPRELHDGDRLRFGEVDAVFWDSPSMQRTRTQLSMADS